MSSEDETEAEEENDGPRSSAITGAFGDSDAAPSFDDGPTTPDEGHINPGEEQTAVLERIEELEQTDIEPYAHDEGGDCAYIPVGDSMLPYLERRRRDGKGFTVNGKRLYWWLDDGLMTKHPWLLLNPTTLANRNYHYDAGIVRDYIDATRGDTFVLADSGGFQIVRHREHEVADNVQDHNWESDLHPQRVLEWQVANADAGTILDIPVYKAYDDFSDQPYDGFQSSEYTEWYDDILVPHTEQTVANAKIAVDRYKEIDYDGFDLMGVVHGMPRQDGNGDIMEAYHRWFDPIDDLYDFEGWSLANRYSNHPGLIATLLSFAAKNIPDAEFIHVLGHGNVWARILSKLYAQMTDTFLTMDGTGFKIGSMFSTMYIPTTYMKSLRLTDRDGENSETRYEKLAAERMPCGCSVCRQVERQIGGKELFEKPGTERMVIMDLHNLNHLLRRFYLLDGFVEARGPALLDEAEVNANADDSEGVEVVANSEFWRILKNWLNESRVAEVYYCMDIVTRAVRGEDIESIFDDYWIKTPFFNETPGGYKGAYRPKVFTKTSSSVFDW